MLAALYDRLLDYDENIRKQVVAVVCDVACCSLTSIPMEAVKLVAERLRDKSVYFTLISCWVPFSFTALTIVLINVSIVFPMYQLLVKKYTMERLAEIYSIYCLKYADGSIKSDEYDWIPGKILRCFYDKDFRQVFPWYTNAFKLFLVSIYTGIRLTV